MHIPNTLPRLHTFISYREEHFGGYAFNPYLLRELPLTRFEFAVLICCEQGEPGGAATAGLARRFGLPRKEAARQIQATLDKLDAYFALRQASADSGARVVPGVGYPPENNETAECASTLPTAYLSAPLSIIWEITHACNLHCMHCLSACGKPAAGELTTAEAQALIDELARRRVFSMTLGGGEPLVRSDVYDLIAYATSKHLCVRLSTNGYAVDDETLRRLAHLNVFSVQVSVDGAEATHNRIRGRPDAFEKALHALQRFGDAGYHTFMTVTANALNVAEIPDLAPLAVRLGVATFKVSPYVPLGRARDHEDTLKLPPTALEELARALREQQRRWGRRLGFQIEGLFPWLLEPPAPGQRTAPAFGPGCSAGIS
ncbi:MAG: radical SAM protein, partial [Anaerolineae bacterium]|nr:radical SAM protein [Anaerolineae bacterium]